MNENYYRNDIRTVKNNSECLDQLGPVRPVHSNLVHDALLHCKSTGNETKGSARSSETAARRRSNCQKKQTGRF